MENPANEPSENPPEIEPGAQPEGEPEILITEVTVTCTTEGCENQNTPIAISASGESPVIICGPCGHPIDPQ